MSLPAPKPGHVAVITGASSGIGADIARELSSRGHELVLVARSGDKLQSLADELTTTAHVLEADLGVPTVRAGLTAELESRGLTPQVLVNNAGFSTLGPVHSSDPDSELKMIEVDVAAVADLCSRFLPGMVERGDGSVLNVASTAAFQPLPGQAGYGAAKAFVLSYTRSLSAELKGTGVTATVLCPGPVSTGFGEAAGFTKEEEEGALPGFLWVSSPDVAKAAVEGMDKGTLVVIPGLANRAGAAFAHLMPKRVLMPFLAKKHPGLP
ncbi:MAG TPA: SDR family oxidoreductase [Nocardioides sp.]|nr:SDR family oxidoreductase [Nocardioides sp.]